MSGFIKAVRNSKNAEQMLERRPTALLLLYMISQRARRTNDSNFDDLELGEAMIGDYLAYGQTEQIYRSDKKFLETFKFITTRATSKGTIAKLVDTSIFDINSEPTNEQANTLPTDDQRSTNEQPTTNKNDKKEKNDKNVKNNFVNFIDHFNKITKRNFKYGDKKAERQFNYLRKNYEAKDFDHVVKAAMQDKHHIESGFRYITPEFVTRTAIFERYLNIKLIGQKEIPKENPEEFAEFINNI